MYLCQISCKNVNACVSLAFKEKATVFCVEISSEDVTLGVCLIMEPVKELHGLMRSCDQNS